MAEIIQATPSRNISALLERITEMSVETYYNPYKMFEWPETLPDEQWWMTPELTTIANTRFAQEIPEQQQMALSKWESIHFYSLNVHGIRELLLEVVKRVQMPGYEEESEFFHHFIGEENEHMWFFATFCLKYGRKIYPSKKLAFSIDNISADIESFLVFSRILIFEEIVDYFNLRMGRDEALHPIIRQVNSIHHQDESRHIAFGREIVKKLFDHITETQPADQVEKAQDYIKRYLVASIQSLYSPAVYRDAGIADPYELRNQLLKDPGRRVADEKALKRTLDFFHGNHILTGEVHPQ
jgi:P-aminobenzoate N-oxygenase AurF